jgi:hypothetical protein
MERRPRDSCDHRPRATSASRPPGTPFTLPLLTAPRTPFMSSSRPAGWCTMSSSHWRMHAVIRRDGGVHGIDERDARPPTVAACVMLGRSPPALGVAAADANAAVCTAPPIPGAAGPSDGCSVSTPVAKRPNASPSRCMNCVFARTSDSTGADVSCERCMAERVQQAHKSGQLLRRLSSPVSPAAKRRIASPTASSPRVALTALARLE